jgi:hypothetical protein
LSLPDGLFHIKDYYPNYNHPGTLPVNHIILDSAAPHYVDWQVLLTKLNNIEHALNELRSQQIIRDWYSTAEVSKLLGKAEFTVREWCRLGRVRAEKRGSGRGAFKAWVISHAELQRLQREGLLPLDLATLLS